ncbi:MAG: DUF120 domain-containing protein [Desulfurococcaceae archaeon]
MKVKGVVFSGIGEGAHYVKLYSEGLKKLLGEMPYPGTLNVILENCFNSLVSNITPIVLHPPSENLGAVYVYLGYLCKLKVLVIRPSITKHDCRVVELVSNVHLRGLLGLRDGNVVELEIVNWNPN